MCEGQTCTQGEAMSPLQMAHAFEFISQRTSIRSAAEARPRRKDARRDSGLVAAPAPTSAPAAVPAFAMYLGLVFVPSVCKSVSTNGIVEGVGSSAAAVDKGARCMMPSICSRSCCTARCRAAPRRAVLRCCAAQAPAPYSPVKVQLQQLRALGGAGQPKLERLVHTIQHGVVQIT